MGILNDMKKLLFGAKAVTKSATEKVVDKAEDIGAKIKDQTEEVVEKAKDIAQDVGDKILPEHDLLIERPIDFDFLQRLAAPCGH